MPVSEQMDISTLPYPWKHFFPGAFSGLAELLSPTYPGLQTVLSQAESGADNTLFQQEVPPFSVVCGRVEGR